MLEFAFIKFEFILARFGRYSLPGVLFLLSLCASLYASTEPAHATSPVKGWCTSTGAGSGACFSDPYQACKAQHDAYAPDQTFQGYSDTEYWYIKHCHWARGLAVPLPATVDFECVSRIDYKKRPPGQCVSVYELYPSFGDEKACSVNHGGTPNPSTPYPISLLTGSKFFDIVDFETADGALELRRRYSSFPYNGLQATPIALPPALGNWRFDFQYELQLPGTSWSSNHKVLILAPDGASYTFKVQSDGSLTTVGYNPQTDYTLSFVGTMPGDLSTMTSGSTTWKLKDPAGNAWTFETFLDPLTGNYDIARPTSLLKRSGLQWSFAYGSYHQLTGITDSYGKEITFDWIIKDPSTVGGSSPATAVAISQANLPGGYKIEYQYESIASGTPVLPQPDRLASVKYLDPSDTLLDQTTYEYTDSDAPLGISAIYDRNDVLRWSVSYDENGRATESTGPSGANKFSIAYARSGSNVTRTVTNPLGKQTEYNYTGGYSAYRMKLNSIAGLASANTPATTFNNTYNSSYFVSSQTDEEGRVTQYTRNARGLPTQIIEGYGTPETRTTTITWDSDYAIPTQIVTPGLTEDYTYDTQGRLTNLTRTDTTTGSVPYSTNGETRSWDFTWSSEGKLLEIDGPLSGTGDTVTYTYDSDGYLATVTNEVGLQTTVTSVNSRGQPLSVDDPNGIETDFGYDGRGRVVSITMNPGAGQAVTTIDYNAVGDVSKITRPDGSYLEYAYDDARRATSVTNNAGEKIEYAYNAAGSRTSSTTKASDGTIVRTLSRTYDELDRLMSNIGASSQTTSFTYDKVGELTTITDPRSNDYSLGYDALGRLISETDQSSATTNYTYDEHDNVVNYEDPESFDTTYVRNGFGDVIRRDSPDTGITDYVVNKLGEVTQMTDARGVVTNLAYDDAGRLVSQTYPASSSENVTYTYDSVAGGNYGKNRLTQMDDASGSTSFVYDERGNLASETRTIQGQSYTTGYTYDLADRIASITYPSGRIVTYDRDSTGRVSFVTTKENSGAASVDLATYLDWQPMSGIVQSFVYGNGLNLWRTFTQDYQLGQLLVEDLDNNTAILQRWHGRTDDINITNIWDGVNPANDQSFWYSPSNRLQNASGPWGDLTFYYDNVGNRTYRVLDDGTTVTQTYNYAVDGNRLLSITEGGATIRSFTYTANGDIETDDRSGTVYSYGWNDANRLETVSVGGTLKGSYLYNGFDQLASRQLTNMTPAGTTHLIYDRAGNLIAEANGATGAILREYVWLEETPHLDDTTGSPSFMPLAVVADVNTTSPKIWFVHPDHLNRPLAMTDENKNVISDSWLPFGKVSGTAMTDARFPGQWNQLESGLAYNWHRHYDPTTGRYTQADPIGLSAGPSLYAYVGGNPINLTDPQGLQSAGVGVVPVPAPMLPITDPTTRENKEWSRFAQHYLGRLSEKILRFQLGLGCATAESPSNRWGDTLHNDNKASSAPTNAPRGTRPIDRWGIPRGDIHDIKDGLGAGPSDWVGVAPDGEVITSGPNGEAVSGGHVDDYTNRPLRKFPRPND